MVATLSLLRVTPPAALVATVVAPTGRSYRSRLSSLQLIGREALEALIQTCGGTVLTIPKRLLDRGPLADLPLPAQEALTRYAGGDSLYIPKAEHLRIRRRNEAIR